MNNAKVVITMEFKEMLLKNLCDNWFEYIAKDVKGNLCAYKEKPFKGEYCWQIEYGYEEDVYNLNAFKSFFDDISWDDDEPFKINNPVEQIDWSSVPVDTKVLVRDNDTHKWKKAYFKEYRANDPYAPFVTFGIGKTSWSASSSSDTGWDQCKLAEDNE